MRRVVSLVDLDDPEDVTMTYLFCNDNSSSHYERHKGVNSALIKSVFCVVTFYNRLISRHT